MKWDDETLDWVYDRTDGCCRYCGKRIYRNNYGMPGERGAWEVDHSVPIALGGTDYLRNLWPSCTECNRDKGTMTGPQYIRLMNGAGGSSSGDSLGGLVALFLVILLLKAFQRQGSGSS